MSSRQPSTRSSPLSDSWLLISIAVCSVAWPALVIGAFIRLVLRRFARTGRVRQRAYRGLWLGIGGMGLLCAGVYVRWMHPDVLLRVVLDDIIIRAWGQLLFACLPLWLVSLWLSPLAAIGMEVVSKPSAEQRLLERARFAREREKRISEHAFRLLQKLDAPEILEECIVLGLALSGVLEAWLHRTKEGGWLLYPAEELRKPSIILGESGSGKTTTMLRLAYLVRKYLQWKIIYVDAKGDHATATIFAALMRQAGVRDEHLKVFPYAAYDGFVGSEDDLFNKLVGVVESSEPYYRDVLKVLLRLALAAPSLAGIPRSSSELLSNLNVERLKILYAKHHEATRVKQFTERESAGAQNRYDAFFGSFPGSLDGLWSFEDTQASYILLEGVGHQEEAETLARYFIQEVSNYATKRKPQEEPVLVFIDDLSAITLGRSAAGLFERLRGYNAFVVGSAQSFASLGIHAEALVGATATKILHRMNNPEIMSRRAGMAQEVVPLIQTREDVMTGFASARVQEIPAVKPEQVQQLRDGEAILIVRGLWQKFRVPPVNISEEQRTRARVFLQQMQQNDPKLPQRLHRASSSLEEEGPSDRLE